MDIRHKKGTYKKVYFDLKPLCPLAKVDNILLDHLQTHIEYVNRTHGLYSKCAISIVLIKRLVGINYSNLHASYYINTSCHNTKNGCFCNLVQHWLIMLNFRCSNYVTPTIYIVH